MASAGYDISASGSSSAGASNSGAIDQAGSYILGPAYGAGSLLLTDQRGSIGAASGTPGVASNLTLVVVALVIAAVVFFIPRK